MRDDPCSTEFARVWEKNSENIDHLRLHPDVRDLSLMVGDEQDVLDREFGPGLPNMRQWAREHFRFSGYTYHFDAAAYADRAALRQALGFAPGERVVVVSAGGTRVGGGFPPLPTRRRRRAGWWESPIVFECLECPDPHTVGHAAPRHGGSFDGLE